MSASQSHQMISAELAMGESFDTATRNLTVVELEQVCKLHGLPRSHHGNSTRANLLKILFKFYCLEDDD